MTTLAFAALVGGPGAHGQGGAATYVAASTVVVKQQNEAPILDDGGVVCRVQENAGIGGACIPFQGSEVSIFVQDAAQDHRVAFQVCLDNDGDSKCGGDEPTEPCADDMWFSHDDAGNFWNPIGRLPATFRSGCPGGPFRGYVVFLCEGVHLADVPGPHAHPASTGVIVAVNGPPTPNGNFCQGLPVVKSYLLT